MQEVLLVRGLETLVMAMRSQEDKARRLQGLNSCSAFDFRMQFHALTNFMPITSILAREFLALTHV